MEHLEKPTTEICFYMNITCGLHICIMDKAANHLKKKVFILREGSIFFSFFITCVLKQYYRKIMED